MNLKKQPNHKKYIQVLRRMTPEERLMKAFELSEFSKQCFVHRLRKRFPDLDEKEIKKLLLKRLEKKPQKELFNMETPKKGSRSNLKIKFLFLVLFLIANFSRLTAQQPHSVTDLKSLDWLIGTWKRETSRGMMVEKWTKVSEFTLEGESFTIQNGDTTFTEYLRVLQFGKEVFYTPKVAHNKYPVPFKLIKADKNIFTFEHSEHDFPQRIIYQQKKDGSLHARIEGIRNGKESGVDFYFRKVE